MYNTYLNKGIKPKVWHEILQVTVFQSQPTPDDNYNLDYAQLSSAGNSCKWNKLIAMEMAKQVTNFMNLTGGFLTWATRQRHTSRDECRL